MAHCVKNIVVRPLLLFIGNDKNELDFFLNAHKLSVVSHTLNGFAKEHEAP